MVSINFFSVLALSTLSTLVVAAPATTAGVPPAKPTGVAIPVNAVPESILQLPADFDLSHPALDYDAMDKAFLKDPHVVSAELPKSITELASAEDTSEFSAADVSAAQVDQIFCESSHASPQSSDAYSIVYYLRNSAPTWCCQTGGEYDCTRMVTRSTATVDICGYRGRCHTCAAIADRVEHLINSCQSYLSGSWKIGGQYHYNYGASPSEIFRIWHA